MVTINHIAKCLSLVHNKLKTLSKKLGLLLNNDNMKWLKHSKGKFLFYVHEESDKYIRSHNSKINIDKTASQMEWYYYNVHHKKIRKSPRCKLCAKPNHQINLEQQLSCFWEFLSLIGDYESMLILLPNPPFNCPSVNVDSMKKYLLYKFLTKDDYLKYNDNFVMTYDFNAQTFSQKLKCLGVVKNPDGFKAFYSSIGNIHVYQNHNGSYRNICINCRHKFFNNRNFRKKIVPTVTQVICIIAVLEIQQIIFLFLT